MSYTQQFRTIAPFALLFSLVLLTNIGKAQLAGYVSALSPEMQQLRDEQAQLAQEQDVRIVRTDRGRLMASALVDVPLEFRELEILDRYDMERVVERLGAYHAFAGTETLVFDEAGPGMGGYDYRYKEFIDGIETPDGITIFVDTQTHRITGFNGNLVTDNGIERVPALSEQQAIDAVIAHIEQGGSQTDPDYKLNPDDYRIGSRHYAELVYTHEGADNALVPSWRVFIELRLQTPNRTHSSFPVASNGTVGSYTIIMH